MTKLLTMNINKELKLKKQLHKIKMRISKLDDIAEASIRFEESNVFTSIQPRNNKYLVKLIEEAWIRRKNKTSIKKAKRKSQKTTC